jgi:hypothetical protein
MTLDQVTRMKDLAYGIGGGIACFVIAYPYVVTTPKEGNPGPRNSGTPPATTDLRASIGLFVAGLIALAASYLVDYIMLGEDRSRYCLMSGWFWWRRSPSSLPDGLPASCAPPLQRLEIVNHD